MLTPLLVFRRGLREWIGRERDCFETRHLGDGAPVLTLREALGDDARDAECRKSTSQVGDLTRCPSPVSVDQNQFFTTKIDPRHFTQRGFDPLPEGRAGDA